MTSTRFLLPGWILVACACPALAQPGVAPRYDLIPSVLPISAQDPAYPSYPTRPAIPLPSPRPAVNSLEQMTGPGATGAAGADPVGTLTGSPTPPAGFTGANGYPVGSYPSPYYVDGPGCCGPLERDGRIGYEIYSYSGVDFVFGSGLPQHLNTGWDIGGSVRTLFFDRSHTAAWTLDLGGSYTHNWGTGGDNPTALFIRQNPTVNATTGVVTQNPDLLLLSAIRGLHRSSFNFNFGRDVWLWGCGNTGAMQGPNLRVGAWIGGRYGTAHVDVVPLDAPNQYARRQNVFEGIVVGAHMSYDVPMGGWILFGGVRAEYGYDWMNIVPPINSNFQSINIQLQAGIRY
jgi:hypothetical protein